jgi:hypothetical protein
VERRYTYVDVKKVSGDEAGGDDEEQLNQPRDLYLELFLYLYILLRLARQVFLKLTNLMCTPLNRYSSTI